MYAACSFILDFYALHAYRCIIVLFASALFYTCSVLYEHGATSITCFYRKIKNMNRKKINLQDSFETSLWAKMKKK